MTGRDGRWRRLAVACAFLAAVLAACGENRITGFGPVPVRSTPTPPAPGG